MAARQRVRTITKKRTKKYGGKTGYKKCPNCGGDGRVRVRNK